MTDDQIRELCILATRDDAERHFTEWAVHWEELEKEGMIRVHRPIHEATGVDCSQEHWSVEITGDGQSVVDYNPHLHPEM
jgi:hypothetical protein